MPEGVAADCRLRGLCDKGQRQLCVSLIRIKMNKWQQLDECSTEPPVFHEDEVGIHLHSKIGADWKMRGQQKRVVTPRQNEKYYLVGSLHSGTGNVSYAGGNSKSSALFISTVEAA
ncbi:IS630 transposase [Escherichia coli]|nr:IS630 transposase [Escherichia coli]